ncbi:MAG: hypothetical protein KF865_05495 [Bdellovibrionaceae bacterium]|nr:hypothetical protein [Pseudobdellovibrionaceae bacterium]
MRRRQQRRLMLFLSAILIAATGAFLSETSEARPRKSTSSSWKKSRSVAGKKTAARKKRAKKRSDGFLCSDRSVATTSVYYTPTQSEYCPKGDLCPEFKRIVSAPGYGTGSGRLNNGQIYRYTGRTERPPKNCETTTGAGGPCLIPYVSVAADMRYYRTGDIIDMPSLRGKRITLPNGKSFEHPGYFVVADVGSAIRGVNRFDTYSGLVGPKNPQNPFGHSGPEDMRMVDKSDCDSHKKFSVIRRGSDRWEQAKADIGEAMNGTSSQVNLAKNRDDDQTANGSGGVQ